MSKERLTLYTIGYEGRTGAGLVRALQDAGVERLVDVRHTPHSRNRDFSVYSLFERLRKGGISYDHIKELGNPPDIRALWYEGDLERGRKKYRSYLTNGSSRAVDLLIGFARMGPTAVLCREKDAEACHRSIVAEVIQERQPDVRVVHL